MILAFVLSADSFQNLLLQNKFSDTNRVTSSLDPDQAQYFIVPVFSLFESDRFRQFLLYTKGYMRTYNYLCICLFVLMLYVPVNNFSVMLGCFLSSGLKQY